MKPTLKVKRAYARPERSDGLRILVDRLWPRGTTKRAAAIDDWVKDLAPTAELRKWFGHDPGLWSEFQKYQDSALITLIYAGKDQDHTHAIVLREYLEKEFDERR